MSAFRKSEGNEVPTRVRKRIWEEGVDVDGNMIRLTMMMTLKIKTFVTGKMSR